MGSCCLVVGCNEQRWGPRPELQTQAWPFAWSVTCSLDLSFPTMKWGSRLLDVSNQLLGAALDTMRFIFFFNVIWMPLFLFIIFISEQTIHSQSSKFKRHKRTCSKSPASLLRGNHCLKFLVYSSRGYTYICVYLPSSPTWSVLLMYR